MKETIGNRVGVYRRKIPLVRAAILFALFLALVTAVAVVLTRRLNTDVFGYLFAYVTSWCLVVACLWLSPLIGRSLSSRPNHSLACRSSRSMFGASPGKVTHLPASSTNAECTTFFLCTLAGGGAAQRAAEAGAAVQSA